MFIVTASCSAACVKQLSQRGCATGFRDFIAECASAAGGRLVHFYFVLGGWSLFMIFDLPRPATQKIVCQLSTDERIQFGSVALNRVNCEVSALERDFSHGAGAWTWL